MNRNYLLDVLALVLFTLSGCGVVHYYHQSNQYESWYQHLNQLEVVAPKLVNELLDINFDSKQHYDNFSQLQLQLDRLKKQLPENGKAGLSLARFEQFSTRYMELATMLKTSKRLIAYSNLTQLSQVQRPKLLELIYAINQFNTSLQQADSLRLKQMLSAADGVFVNSDTGAFSWDHFKQHYLFVLDNANLADELRKQLQRINISEDLIEQRDIYNQLLTKSQRYMLVSLFCVLLSFILLFVAVLMRQQKELHIKSEQHREAAAVKTRFLANMSHEIRTPMTGIIGLAELTLGTELNQRQRDYLEKLHFSASSLLVIINDILDFSKIESGKMNIEQVEFEHGKLFDNLTVMLGKGFKQKPVELIYDIDDSVPRTLVGDPVRTSQILLNLVNNAIKFTESGHVIVKCQAIAGNQEVKQDGIVIEYQVFDTGIGLSEEQMNKLFQRFEQADDSTTRKYGGTGLGLSIVKQLVELKGGTISVNSTLGKGSCFTVRLPYKTFTSDLKTNAPLSKLTAKNILIIEDNPVTSLVLNNMASNMGLEVEAVKSVKEAAELCQTRPFCVALIDWHLPEQSGLEFIRLSETLPFKPERMIICSAYDLDFIKSQIDFDVAFEYVPKPLTKWNLHSAIERGGESQIVDNAETVSLTESENAKLSSKQTPVKVLLVEDNKVNQTIASSMLTSFGVEFDIAENGKIAIENLEKNEYDLVFMDIQMPVMDGLEATRVIRQQYSPEQLPIIALTANVTEEEVDSYLALGMNAHLCKPYNKEAIAETIERFAA